MAKEGVNGISLPESDKNIWIQYLATEIDQKDRRNRFAYLIIVALASLSVWFFANAPSLQGVRGEIIYGIVLAASLTYLFAIKKIIGSIFEFLQPSQDFEEKDNKHIIGFARLVKQKGLPFATRIYFLPAPIAQLSAITAAFLLLNYSSGVFTLSLIFIMIWHVVSLMPRLVLVLAPKKWVSGFVEWFFEFFLALEVQKKALADNQKDKSEPFPDLFEKMGLKGKKLLPYLRIFYALSLFGVAWMLYPSAEYTYEILGSINSLKLVSYLAIPALLMSLMQLIIYILLDLSKKLLSNLKSAILLDSISEENWRVILSMINTLSELKLFYSVAFGDIKSILEEGPLLEVESKLE